MTGTTSTRTEAHLRQLCCLGLRGEALVPALLRELHLLVPSVGNGFFWADPDGTLANVYDESPESIKTGPLYAEEFYNKRELEVHRGFSHALRTRRGIVPLREMLTVDEKAFFRSDFYNLIMRPMGYADILQLYIRTDGRPLGVLQLQRGPGERPFSATEARRLERLETFVTHALTSAPPAPEGTLIDSADSGLIIADRSGRLLGFSANGRRLLSLATRRQLLGHAAGWLPEDIAGACRSLAAVFEGAAAARRPAVVRCNAWGRFVFRAHWLDATVPGFGEIGITVTRQEPVALRLLRGARELGLSPRQTDVAILLGSGQTHRDIGQRLGVSRHTVISHVRWIYARLDVHDSIALREKLLAAGART